MNPALAAVFAAIVGGLAIWASVLTQNAVLYLLGIVCIMMALFVAISHAFGDIE